MNAKYTDQQLDITLGHLLRSGVILSAAVVLTGGIIYLARHGGVHPEYGTFRGEPQSFRNLRGIGSGVFNGSGRSVIQLGVLLLVATPVARVAFSVYAFLRERDYLYVAVTLTVLALLLYSIFASHF